MCAGLAVFVLLFLGLFTRMNGFFALSISAQLMIGLAPGRIFGLDALIRKWAAPTAQRDNVVAKLVMLVS